MTGALIRYLDLAYQQDVLGKPVDARAAIEDTVEFKSALEQERGRIKKFETQITNGFGELSKRDFVAYQHLRAIEAALALLKDGQHAS